MFGGLNIKEVCVNNAGGTSTLFEPHSNYDDGSASLICLSSEFFYRPGSLLIPAKGVTTSDL